MSRNTDGWYFDHLAAANTGCKCSRTGPDPKCDKGEALWRLKIAAKERLTVQV